MALFLVACGEAWPGRLSDARLQTIEARMLQHHIRVLPHDLARRELILLSLCLVHVIILLQEMHVVLVKDLGVVVRVFGLFWQTIGAEGTRFLGSVMPSKSVRERGHVLHLDLVSFRRNDLPEYLVLHGYAG